MERRAGSGTHGPFAPSGKSMTQNANSLPPESPRRIVVKEGTSTLTNAAGGIDRAFIADLTAQLSAQKALGRDVLLVTSGAIRAGREQLEKGMRYEAKGMSEEASTHTSYLMPHTLNSLPYKQAAAAIGQGRLIHTYTEAFAWRDVNCAQILLTRDDLSDRRRFLNARNTLQALLSLGVVPVINENDTVAVDEIRFGDNDNLAALVATLVDADLLLILSDVEGLYERPPTDANDLPPLISVVPRIDAAIEALAGGVNSGVGTGGMRTKIEAARIAAAAGIRAVIARGRREKVIAGVIAGEPIGTTFLPRSNSDRLPARKGWIAHGARAKGGVTVNEKAREKLQTSGVSLLAVGIVGVTGNFSAGDLIEAFDEAGVVFGRGLTNYAASEIQQIMGLRSEEFAAVLGPNAAGYDEIIHRDNLVLNDK